MIKNTLTVLQIIFTTGGSIALIIATVLSIHWITVIDRKISDLSGTISKLRDGRIGGMVTTINFGKDFVFRRIELLERNLLIWHRQPEAEVVEITKRIFNTTAKMAKQWSYWYGGEQAQKLEAEASLKLQEIIENSSLSPLQKIDAAENVWKESMAQANERLQSAQKQLQENEATKVDLEKERRALHNKFVAWQLGGLISLALGGLIQGVLRL